MPNRGTGPPKSVLAVRSRQQVRPVDRVLLRKLTRWLLVERLSVREFEIGVHLVAAAEISRLNEAFLGHAGATDVITFDYREPEAAAPVCDVACRRPERCGQAQDRLTKETAGQALFHGEIYISLDAAVTQARRFRTSWQSELARYLIHGFLHLAGYDDLEPAARRCMKQEEDRLLQLASATFPIRQLARKQQRNN
jgi:rRNA maturation RNase YbeY